MTYDVEISDKAFEDIESRFEFLSRVSKPSARRWYQRLRKAFVSLTRFPARCPLAPEDETSKSTIRQLVHGKRPHQERILFEVRDKTVYILRVRHGRQDTLTDVS
jgi:plasmid stabilization system protein ParE